MINILTHIDRDNDLTYFITTGSVSSKEMVNLLEKYYSGYVTKDIVWDLRHGNIVSLFNVLKKGEIGSFKYNVHSRTHGNTVFLVSSNTDYGISRMLQVAVENNNYDFNFHVCFTIEETEAILGKNLNREYLHKFD